MKKTGLLIVALTWAFFSAFVHAAPYSNLSITKDATPTPTADKKRIIPAHLLLLLGDDGSQTAKRSVEVVFPAPVSLTNSETLQVRGTTDPDAGVTGIRINGVVASSSDGFATWTVAMSIGEGRTELVVEDKRADGFWRLSGARPVVIRVSVLLGNPGGMVVDAPRNRALVVDSLFKRVAAFDLATGRLALVSGPGRGLGVALRYPNGIALHEGGTKALVADYWGNALVSLALSSGDRTELSGPNQGSGVALSAPSDLRVDAPRGRAIVRTSQPALLAVDLDTGARSLLSNSDRGAGPMFDYGYGMIVDPAGTHVYLHDDPLNALLSIDLATGNRSILADASHGKGPWSDVGGIGGLEHIMGTAEALLFRWYPDPRLYRVDLVVGDRTALPALDYEEPPPPHLSGSMKLRAVNPVDGKALVLDTDGSALVSVNPNTGKSLVLARFGQGVGSVMANLGGLAWDGSRGRALVVSGGALEALLAVDLSGGDRTRVAFGYDPGPRFAHARDAVLDEAAGRLLVATRPDAIIAINVSNGERSVVSSATVGTGPVWDIPVGIALDADRSRAFILDWGSEISLVAVDLASGNRTLLSDATRGTGPAFHQPRDVAFDITGQRLLAINDESVVAIDPTSGDRATLSGKGHGAGPMFSSPEGLVVDADNNRALVVDRQGSLLAVDLGTGQRSIVSDATRGAGPLLNAPEFLALGPDGLVLVDSYNLRALYIVDPQTGDRAIISR